MNAEIKERLELWLGALDSGDPLRQELLGADEDDINDRFYKSLSFGTAGLRGVMGAGTNRMNRFTVAQASRGFGEYLKEISSSPRAAVSYDTRINSKDFALITARVLADMGIEVFIYPDAMPTPMLSFAVRELGCSGGVMITASHNPKEYNGYKAYGPDGCQIDEETADRILEHIGRIDLFKAAHVSSSADGSLIKHVPESVIRGFYSLAAQQVIEKEAVRKAGLRIVYTPLNGTGLIPVKTVLSSLGVRDLAVVKSQEAPDGSFPTCPKPNPELEEAFNEAVALAADSRPDIIIATDPDADRIACAVPSRGGFRFFTGNEIGLLFIDYELSRRAEHCNVPRDPYIIKSIVSSPLADMVSEYYGCRMESTLTGFKNICGRLREHEAKGDLDCFIMGYEESIGYMFGTFVRDKDAVTSCAKLVEMASWYKLNGTALTDALEGIYERLGYCLQNNKSYYYEGEEGGRTMSGIMTSLREAPPLSIGGKDVLTVTDYLTGRIIQMPGGEASGADLPRSDVLIFSLEGGCSVTVRPSGTEPKLKLYCSAISEDRRQAEAAVVEIAAGMDLYCKK